MFLFSFEAKAQYTDTTKTAITNNQPVTGTQKTAAPSYHSPKKAALMSTFLPGLGQAYNKKYWKIPVIYAGFVGLVYSINFNETKYVGYRNDYQHSLDSTYTGPYSLDDLLILQKYYHRYRDLSVIGAALLYVLNIVDASVDAHMFTFDVSNDLSFKIQPTIINSVYTNQYTTGVSIGVKF